MIVRATENRAGPGELIAALGGVVLLAAVLAPIDWVSLTSTGGLTGRGTGEPPRGLTAADVFGAALLPVVLAAAVPLAELLLRLVGRSIAAAARSAAVAAGLIVLVVGVAIELTYSAAPCCDRIYTMPSPEAGLIPAFAGGALLALGTAAAWLRIGADSRGDRRRLSHTACPAPSRQVGRGHRRQRNVERD